MTAAEIVIGGDSVDIPPGTYRAKLVAITTKHSERTDSDFRTWDFVLESGSLVGGASSMATSSRSKGGRWIKALMGGMPEKGATVDLADRWCLVVVGLNAEDWPFVEDVLPPMATTEAPGAPEPVLVALDAIPADLPF